MTNFEILVMLLFFKSPCNITNNFFAHDLLSKNPKVCDYCQLMGHMGD